MFDIPQPEITYSGPTFTFMGWEFNYHEYTSEGYSGGHLVSWHRLVNADPPNAIYAYKCYKPGSTEATREYAAAWLIAHWFEHYMGICPCLHGDGPSNFRTACIEALLSYGSR